MSLQRNYYEVLGIPPGASTDQIKKKYRELARKFHPDVVQDKVLGQRVFSQINQAYRILADPERREQYNSQLAAASAPPARTAQPVPAQPPPSQAPTAQQAAPRPQPAAPTRPQATSQPQPAPMSQQTSRPQARPAASPPRPAAPQAQPGSAQKAQAMAGLLANADNAIMAGKFIEARIFCVKVLEIDPKNVRALEIMGDALVGMGKPEDAAVQYRNALAITPSSMIQSKLNRLDQAATATRTNPPGGGEKPDGEKPGGLFGRLLGRK